MVRSPFKAKPEGQLKHFISIDRQLNKSKATRKEVPRSKEAVLDYQFVEDLVDEKMSLLKINLQTGRHHQIRS